MAYQASLTITISWSLLKLMSSESVMPSNNFILGHPLLLLPSVFPNIRVFSSELAFCIMWANYWSFSFSISPSNDYSGLMSFRIDWFEYRAFLVAQRLKHLPAMWETQVRSLGWEAPLQPTPVFLPGESHGGRSLLGYSPWGRVIMYIK